MDWTSLPVELFAKITTYCSPTEILNFEYVCKVWKEHLRDDWIWKTIALRNMAGFALPSDIYDWKSLVLKRQFVIKNMQQKRCISRSFASEEYVRAYNQMKHHCSVAGDEALITWINFAAFSGSSVVGHELVNLITGKRTQLKLFESGNAIMTKYFIITSQVWSAEGVSECSTDLHVVDRRTNNLLKPYLIQIPKKGTIFKNEDPNYKDGSIIAIRMDNLNSLKAVIVDLESKTKKILEIPSPEGDKSNYLQLSFKFYGKYLATSQMHKTTSKQRLVIFNIETDQVIYDREIVASSWCIADDRVILVTCTKYDIQWIIHDFNNNLIGEFKTSSKTMIAPAAALSTVSVRLYGNILLIVGFSRAWFCDIKNSKLLCDLHLIGWPEYGHKSLHDLIGSGKFVFSIAGSTRMIDFESISIIKEFKPQILLPEHDYGVIDEWKRPIPFHELMEFAMTVIDDPSSTKYASILISYDETKNERTSLICLARENFNKMHSSDPENQKATELIRNMDKAYRSVNMVMARFTFDESNRLSHGDFLKSTYQVRGRAVLYKEKLINGEWIPIDA